MTYAIIETGGKQYWVEPGETIRVDRLEGQAGSEIKIKALWAVGEAKDGGTPRRSQDAQVVAEVVSHPRGPKIIVFQKKPKKAYQRTRGHRADLTSLRVKSINL
jgi:large subunit ribosomal protein L21